MRSRRWRRKLPTYPKRPDRSDEFASYKAPRRAAFMGTALDTRDPVTVEKDNPLRSETYRRLVAAMDCIHCGRKGPGVCQAAHADQNKGTGLKSDDRTCYPACATKPGRPGCHDIIGASGYFTKWQRRALEEGYAERTRAAIIMAGLWPESLPPWQEAVA